MEALKELKTIANYEINKFIDLKEKTENKETKGVYDSTIKNLKKILNVLGKY